MGRRPSSVIRLIAAVLAGLAGIEAAVAGETVRKEQPVSFIREVAPILKENCFACHDAHKRKGNLDMSTYESLRQGGDGDDSVVPGRPQDSLLWQRITATGARRMPPEANGAALSPSQVALMARWIRQGARLDAGLDPRADLLREIRLRWEPPVPPPVYAQPVPVTALAFTPDGRRLAAGGYHELTVWDVATAALCQRVRTRMERAYALLFLPDGTLAVAGGRPGQEGDVRVYDLYGPARTEGGVAFLDGVHDRQVLLRELAETDDAVLCLGLAADGRRLAAGGCDRRVRVWDLDGRRVRLNQTIEIHADWVCGVALTSDGRRVVSASRDGTAKVWDLERRQSMQTFGEHLGGLCDVVLRGDDRAAISVGEDGRVRSWMIGGEGKALAVVRVPRGGLLKVAGHRRLPILATGGAEGVVRLWDPSTLAPLRQLAGLSDWVDALAVSPDGRWIAAGAWDGEVRVWKSADGSLVRAWNASPGLRRRSVPGHSAGR